jgi:four helix bundle protein
MTSNQHTTLDIEERMMKFSINVFMIVKNLPKNHQNEVVAKQLTRSASSIGANFVEANNASSRADFRNKIFISKKEAAETRYWLRLLGAVNDSVDTSPLLDVCTQFLFILQKIVSTLKVAR